VYEYYYRTFVQLVNGNLKNYFFSPNLLEIRWLQQDTLQRNFCRNQLSPDGFANPCKQQAASAPEAILPRLHGLMGCESGIDRQINARYVPYCLGKGPLD